MKLGIREGSRVALVGAPEDFVETLGVLPEGASLVEAVEAGLDVIVFFTTLEAELRTMFLDLGRALQPAGGLWVAWPKRASRVATDITEDVLREVILPSGLVDNKVCAIDERWSGLRFVWRKERRVQNGEQRPG